MAEAGSAAARSGAFRVGESTVAGESRKCAARSTGVPHQTTMRRSSRNSFRLLLAAAREQQSGTMALASQNAMSAIGAVFTHCGCRRALAAKRTDYFAAGTLVVWDVDLFDKTHVNVYRSTDPDACMSYGRGTRAEAEPALPGWSFPIDDLFPPAEN